MSHLAAKSRDELHRDEIDFFAKYYESQAYNPLGWRLRLQRELRSLLKRNGNERLGRVLSLGCGDGQFEMMLAEHADQVVGLDLSPEAIRIANQNSKKAGLENVEFQCRPLEDLEWKETYDTVVVLATIHHVPPNEVVALLKTIHRHLAPGGLFYSQDPNQHGILRSIGRLVLGKRYDSYHTPDERELDPKTLVQQLTESGFENVTIDYIDLALIPGLFFFPKGKSWLMRPLLWVDKIWCATPAKRFASGFNASARRAAPSEEQ